MSKLSYRSFFISDTHLGTKESNVDALIEFLKHNNAEYVFLVGDIVDLWLGKKLLISPNVIKLVRQFLKKAQQGSEVYYLPGNHDEVMRALDGYSNGNIHITNEIVHEGIDGKKYMVVHGDLFDTIVMHNKWLSHLGATAYDVIVILTYWYRRLCTLFGMRPKSLASYIRTKVKSVVKFLTNFESILIKDAKGKGCDGVIAGHIHSPVIKMVDGLRYINCGDWLEHCSLIVEHIDGKFEILYLNETTCKTAEASL